MSSLPNANDEIVSPLLSQIAEDFQVRMSSQLSDQVRDGSTYKGAFTGRIAVDQLAIVLDTSDRQLALLIGRSLNAQGLFSDVKKERNLFEDSEEIYQFGVGMKEGNTPEQSQQKLESGSVNGVWTLLTKCYSASCNESRGSGLYKCYSCICPRGATVEQRSRY
ncbi:hypothetical protein SCHPADRAFT_731025 [Schizopora paradoxa]|uniref:DEP domain-containing protein n=1 Tax=Schizopora paradoxa TaxID=27342 RepID=A0A0H2RKH5_9AGAM|nr:hypothetical protein SCHPADRAFT_731025 [Schizopora paradoxa]